MDCRTAERLISLQPDGLTTEESTGLAMHIAGCPSCAREQQLQERLSRTLGEMGRLEVAAPAGLADSVMKQLEAERRIRSKLIFIPAGWRKAVAAAAALLLMAGGSAGITSGIWKMADGGKAVVMESTSAPAVSAGNGSEYTAGDTATGEPVEGAEPAEGDPGSPGGPQIRELSGETTGGSANAATGNNEEEHIGNEPAETSSGNNTVPEPVAPGIAAVMLSKGMTVNSTILKFAVDDMDSARAKAVSIAAGFGAANQVFPEQNNGKAVVVMRMTVESGKASDLIASLGGVGTLVDRQDESRDLTALYNETMVKYQDLQTRKSAAQSSEEKRQLESQASSYKQQLDAWAEEAGKRVVVVWLEGK